MCQPVGFRDCIDVAFSAFLNSPTLGPIYRGTKVKTSPVFYLSGDKITYVPIHINLSAGLTVVGGWSPRNEHPTRSQCRNTLGQSVRHHTFTIYVGKASTWMISALPVGAGIRVNRRLDWMTATGRYSATSLLAKFCSSKYQKKR